MTGLDAGDRYLMVNPYFHMFGLKAGILASLAAGATMLPGAGVRRRPGAAARRRRAGDRAARRPDAVPVDPRPPRPRPLRPVQPAGGTSSARPTSRSSSSGASSPSCRSRCSSRATGSPRAALPAATAPDDDPETIATTVGRPRPGFELRIVDQHGDDVPRGEAGEILLRGGSVMLELPRRSRGHRSGAVARRLAAHRRPRPARRGRAACRSWAASRTCSSSAGSTPTRPRSRTTCCATPTCSRRR